MSAAAPHPRQPERLAALQRTGMLDAPREADFDEVAALAARLCGTPIAVVNLIDHGRQFFLAEVGLGVRETPLDTSLCAHVILQPGLTVIEDTATDPRLACNPLVTGDPGLRFYAGAVLETEEGLPVGTLCVLDHRPRGLDEGQREALRVLAMQVTRQLQLRAALRDLADAAAREAVLAREVDHRVKNSLQIVSSLLRLQAGAAADDDTAEALDEAGRRVEAIAALHGALHAAEQAGRVALPAFMERVATLAGRNLPAGVSLLVECEPLVVDGAVAAACGVLVSELVANAARHAFPHGGAGTIRVEGRGGAGGYVLAVEDDGVGFGAAPPGDGLGLAIVDASAAQMGATARREAPARGARVAVTLPP